MSGPVVGSSSVALSPAVSGGGTNGAAGIFGLSDSGYGVSGNSTSGSGVRGQSQSGEGVHGGSSTKHGVHGINGAGSGTTTQYGSGVWGESDNGYGVFAASKSNDGVHADCASSTASAVVGLNSAGGIGVSGKSDNGYGVYAASKSSDGVHADCASRTSSAVAGLNSAGGIGVYGSSSGNAGQFDGKVLVTGTITATDVVASGNVRVTGKVTASDVMLSGADCAEQFDAAVVEASEPGTVLVIDDNGALRPSSEPYDPRAAGVVSGAGAFRPAVVMDAAPSTGRRTTLALVGKVYCKADAEFGAIAIGDLLTTSATSGFAMKASDRERAFGAVIGKALAPLASGRGLLPILIALQ